MENRFGIWLSLNRDTRNANSWKVTAYCTQLIYWVTTPQSTLDAFRNDRECRVSCIWMCLVVHEPKQINSRRWYYVYCVVSSTREINGVYAVWYNSVHSNSRYISIRFVSDALHLAPTEKRLIQSHGMNDNNSHPTFHRWRWLVYCD